MVESASSPAFTQQQIEPMLEDPSEVLKTIANQSMQATLGSYALSVQLRCQNFCETKTLNDAQKLIDSNTQNLTKESIDALEQQCNKLCQRKFFKAYHFQHMLQTQPIEEPK